jgi:hypothetical protein
MRILVSLIVAASLIGPLASHAGGDAVARPLVRSGDADVWKSEPDGAIRHVQSGLLCPPKIGKVTLWSGDVFPSVGRGGDVGCDYGRGPEGNADAKLTIFAVRAPREMTLDTAFEKYRDEMHQSYPEGTNARAAIEPGAITTSDARAPVPEVRSEGISVTLHERAYRTEVAVMLISGWIIEIRSTYPTEFSGADTDIGVDVINLSAAVLQAAASVGGAI